MVNGLAIAFLAGFLAAATAPRCLAAEDAAVIKEGKKVTLEYTLTVDGKVFDSSVGRQPLEYTQGKNMIIPGLEKQLDGLAVGSEKTIEVNPEEGYGEIRKEGFREFPRSSFSPNLTLEEGQIIMMKNTAGQSHSAKIASLGESAVLLDFNHPLAGKALSFKVKILKVE